MNRLHSWLARIDRASLRERVLLFVAAALVLTLLWYELALSPLDARRSRLSAELNDLKAPAGAGGPASLELAGEFSARMSRESALRSAIAAADRDLEDARSRMIAPDDMVQVLTSVLRDQPGLTLLLIRNLPPEPLVPLADKGAHGATATAEDAAADGGEAPGNEGPYLHPIELVLQGGYLDVLTYLKSLETESAGFQWRRFEYRGLDADPEYRIEFATVSMDANWLGV